ncbi:MAG: hypothetical protein AAGL10_15485 [Pseudomonadota bacterium]
MERPLIERDLDAMQLLEWALEFGDTDYAATQIAGASVPIAIRRQALDLLETQNALSVLGDLDISYRKHV